MDIYFDIGNVIAWIQAMHYRPVTENSLCRISLPENIGCNFPEKFFYVMGQMPEFSFRGVLDVEKKEWSASTALVSDVSPERSMPDFWYEKRVPTFIGKRAPMGLDKELPNFLKKE